MILFSCMTYYIHYLAVVRGETISECVGRVSHLKKLAGALAQTTVIVHDILI